MSLKQYQMIIDKFAFLSRVVLTGAGEPLRHPDITRMVEYTSQKGIITTLTTNATLLSPELGHDLISNGLDHIDFSVDGTTPETYQTLRNADFEQVLSNIRTFIELKKKAQHPLRCGLNFLAQDKNIEELPLLPDLAFTLGVDEIKIMPMHDWGHELPRKYYEKSIKNTQKRLEMLLPETKIQAQKRKISLSFLSPCISDTTCLWPWRSCYITSDGYVTLCCVLAGDPTRYSYGNIFTSSVPEIWNNETIARFRKHIKKQRTCTFYRSEVRNHR